MTIPDIKNTHASDTAKLSFHARIYEEAVSYASHGALTSAYRCRGKCKAPMQVYEVTRLGALTRNILLSRLKNKA